mgnify:CR=1 FL=1
MSGFFFSFSFVLSFFLDIKTPIDMEMIEERLGSGHYTAVREYEADMRLLFSNAVVFNEPGSQISNDAQRLRKVLKRALESVNSDVKAIFAPPSPVKEATASRAPRKQANKDGWFIAEYKKKK